MNKKPLISIIVPVYNVQFFLDKCIESILNQTYQNIEVVVVDDGSIDESYKICKKWSTTDERIKLFQKENGGLSSARNYGLKKSTGDFIGFVDGDDYISKDMYENLLRLVYNSNKTIGQTMMVDVFPDFESCDTTFYDFSEETYTAFLSGICLQKRSTSCCSKLFPRDFFDNVSFWEGRTNEDFLLFFSQKYRDYKIVCDQKKGYFYVQRENSITHKGIGVYRDAIINSLSILENEHEHSDLRVCLERFFLHYCSRYVFALAKHKNKVDVQFVKSLRSAIRKEHIIFNNRYLNKTDKIVAKCFIRFPSFIVFVLKIMLWFRRLFKNGTGKVKKTS